MDISLNNNRGYEIHGGRKITRFNEHSEEPISAKTDLWNSSHIIGKDYFKKKVIA